MKLVALWLCLVCVIVFILQLIFGTDVFILDKALVWHEPWRLVTSIFAHDGIVHLLSNLFALALFGLILEGSIGPKRVFWLFMISGILINIFTPYAKSLGASGAIYAILGCLTVLRPLMVIWIEMLPMPMFIAALIWVVQDTFGLFFPTNVGNMAHLGGLGIGLAMGFIWRKQFGEKIKFKKRTNDPTLERALDDWERKYKLR